MTVRAARASQPDTQPPRARARTHMHLRVAALSKLGVQLGGRAMPTVPFKRRPFLAWVPFRVYLHLTSESFGILDSWAGNSDSVVPSSMKIF